MVRISVRVGVRIRVRVNVRVGIRVRGHVPAGSSWSRRIGVGLVLVLRLVLGLG